MISKTKITNKGKGKEGKEMTNLERIMKDLKTTIGEKQRLGQMRKPRKSTRADGTNPRTKGTNPRAVGTNPKATRSLSETGKNEAKF